jgi:hypothetical protein
VPEKAVRGQVLGEGFAGRKITLSGDDREFSAAIGQLSEFQFENVAAGRYSMTIETAETLIVIEELDLS